MSFKNLLFAATLASSSLTSFGNDVPSSIQQTQNKTSHKVHNSLDHNEGQKSHLHVEAFAGVEYNHLLDHGQLMEGDFTSFSIHASLDNW